MLSALNWISYARISSKTDNEPRTSDRFETDMKLIFKIFKFLTLDASNGVDGIKHTSQVIC